MDIKLKLKDYDNLSYDDKVNFIKSMNDLSEEEITKVKDILDESTNPEEIIEGQNFRRGFDWLVNNKYFHYIIYGSIFVWLMFILNLFTGFNFRTFLVVLVAELLS
tara:strand:+ start:251 stop:568 length:318 start_codon:yes stop_codon:yes gene_type:complete